MNINVRFFARAKDIVGAEQISLELSGDADNQHTIGDVRTALIQRYPGLKPMAGSLLFAIDTDYVHDTVAVAADNTVVCFPPVSGG